MFHLVSLKLHFPNIKHKIKWVQSGCYQASVANLSHFYSYQSAMKHIYIILISLPIGIKKRLSISNHKERVSTLSCENEPKCCQLLNFHYFQVSASNVQNLVTAACLFQMHLITDECCQFLESQLHVNNCIGIWRFADTYGMTDLTEVCMLLGFFS